MNMGQHMTNALLPVYVKALGSDATVVGIVVGLFAATALGIRPIAGPAMDYFKKGRLLTFAIGAITIAFICYGFSTSVSMIIAARLIHGVGIGMAAPLSLALASNTLPDSKMASGLGIFSLGAAVATAVGPLIGLELADAIGYSSTFFICAVVMAFCFILTLLIREEAPVRTGRFKIRLNQAVTPEIILPTLVIFFQILSFSSINSFIAIFGELNGVEDIGLFFTASAVCLIIFRPLSGKIADSYGLDKTVIPGLVIFMGGLLAISFSRTLPMFIVAGMITSTGFGISQPILQTMNMQLVPKARRGAASNTNYMGIDIGFLLGPMFAGAVITTVENRTGSELIGISTMYRVVLLPVVVAIVLFAVNKKKLMIRMKNLQNIQAQENTISEEQ